VPALAALAARSTLVWHGQGVVHVRSRAGLAWGIYPWDRCEANGEVIGQEADGALLTKWGCPQWPWRLAGRRGVLSVCLCGVGSW
jgi:hypothetical protein